jgi:hypothetical protein
MFSRRGKASLGEIVPASNGMRRARLATGPARRAGICTPIQEIVARRLRVLSKMTRETAHPSFTDSIHVAFFIFISWLWRREFSPSHETNEQVMHYQSSEPMVDRSNTCHWRWP